MSPKERIPQTGENPSGQVEHPHRIRRALLLGTSAAAACVVVGGVAFGANIIHGAYVLSPHAEKSVSGGEGTVTGIVPLIEGNFLGATASVKGGASKYDYKMSGAKDIPIVGKGIANISLAYRAMTVDSTVDMTFYNETMNATSEIDLKKNTYTVLVPIDKVSVRTSIDFGDPTDKENTKFKHVPDGSTLNGIVAGAQAFVNSSVVKHIPGFDSAVSGLNATDSALVAAGALADEATAAEVCGPKILAAAGDTYLADVANQAKAYVDADRKAHGEKSPIYAAKFVQPDGKTPANASDIVLTSKASAGLAEFLKGDGASVANGKFDAGQCKLSDAVAKQVNLKAPTNKATLNEAKG